MRIGTSDKKQLGHMRDAMDFVLQEGLSIELLTALLAIAIEAGLSVNELADRLQAPQQTASRYASILLGRYADPTSDAETEKAPLVTQEVHANDPRKRAMFLTDRGYEFIAHLLSRMSGKK